MLIHAEEVPLLLLELIIHEIDLKSESTAAPFRVQLHLAALKLHHFQTAVPSMHHTSPNSC